MTITYSLDVSSSNLTSFIKLCFRWKGSLWKSVYLELLIWLFIYALFSLLYRYGLANDQKSVFEDVAAFFHKYSELVPLTFMLGFFVNLVVTRWWEMFMLIGWIDSVSLYVATYVRGKGERARVMRRNVIRYLVLIQAMIFRDISLSVRRRFPTEDTLQAGGFMSVSEQRALSKVQSPHRKYWVPAQWALNTLRKAKAEGCIRSDDAFQDLIAKVNEFRTNVSKLSLYDWAPVPLVYTQVVFLTVRCYFIVALMGRQFVTDRRRTDAFSPLDIYVPVLTIIQFIFYVGWMKVAEALLNPFGEDDDDFEVNWLLDRNLQVGLTIVDGEEKRYPALEKDPFWNEPCPEPLYSTDTANVEINPMIGSVSALGSEQVDVKMVNRVSDVASVASSSATDPSSNMFSLGGVVRKISQLRKASHSVPKNVQNEKIDGENPNRSDEMKAHDNLASVMEENEGG